jgi:hypothetical protein
VVGDHLHSAVLGNKGEKMTAVTIDSRGPALHVVLAGFIIVGRFPTLEAAQLAAGIHAAYLAAGGKL